MRQGTDSDGFRSLFELSGISMAVLDARLSALEANAEYCRQFGRSAAEMRGCSLYDLLHASTHERVRRQFARLAGGHRGRFAERVVGIGPEESAFIAEITGIAVHERSRPSAMFVVIVRPGDAGRAPAPPEMLLTGLDARILEGVAAGISTVQLAAKLYMSRQGVEYHVSGMLRRLQAPNRAALVSRAYHLGVLSRGTWPPEVAPGFIK